jgi:hypothetical protein
MRSGGRVGSCFPFAPLLALADHLVHTPPTSLYPAQSHVQVGSVAPVAVRQLLSRPQLVLAAGATQPVELGHSFTALFTDHNSTRRLGGTYTLASFLD